MLYPSSSMDFSDFRQYTVWLLAMLIATFGLRYVKEIIIFVLDKFYQFFIQNNVSSL